jgi:hypothetical protein
MREEEDPHVGGPVRTGSVGDPVELLHHFLEVLFGGDGDEGVEVIVGELVLDGDGALHDLADPRKEVS